MSLGKKAIMESGTKILIVLLLGICFTVLAYVFFTGTGQKVIEDINARVAGKAGLEPVAIPGLGKVNIAQERGLIAKITVTPGLPACEGETLELSAYNSSLPEGVFGSNLQCSWDFDVSKDGDADGKPDNDKDAENCKTALKAEAGDKTIKLAVKVTGEVSGAGLSSSATVSIHTLVSCACTSARCALNELSLTEGTIRDWGHTDFKLPKDADIKGIHIRVVPDSGAKIKNGLRIDAGGANVPATDAYYFTGDITDEFIIDGYLFEVSVPGRSTNLVSQLNNILRTCRQQDLSDSNGRCTIQLGWHFATEPAGRGLKINSIYVPYVPLPY